MQVNACFENPHQIYHEQHQKCSRTIKNNYNILFHLVFVEYGQGTSVH